MSNSINLDILPLTISSYNGNGEEMESNQEKQKYSKFTLLLLQQFIICIIFFHLNNKTFNNSAGCDEFQRQSVNNEMIVDVVEPSASEHMEIDLKCAEKVTDSDVESNFDGDKVNWIVKRFKILCRD